MKRSLMLLGMGAALLFPLSAEEKPKTGVVHIQTLFRGYYKTLEAQAQINAERARIQKEENEMLQRVKVFDEKLRDQTKRLQDSELEEAERSALSRDVGMLFQEREALERLRKQSIQARHLKLNQKMVARMNGILEEIRGIIAESAEGAGFDYVFDVEGLSTAQVPFLLYAKDATDITPMIQKELGKGAPAE